MLRLSRVLFFVRCKHRFHDTARFLCVIYAPKFALTRPLQFTASFLANFGRRKQRGVGGWRGEKTKREALTVFLPAIPPTSSRLFALASRSLAILYARPSTPTKIRELWTYVPPPSKLCEYHQTRPNLVNAPSETALAEQEIQTGNIPMLRDNVIRENPCLTWPRSH